MRIDYSNSFKLGDVVGASACVDKTKFLKCVVLPDDDGIL